MLKIETTNINTLQVCNHLHDLYCLASLNGLGAFSFSIIEKAYNTISKLYNPKISICNNRNVLNALSIWPIQLNVIIEITPTTKLRTYNHLNFVLFKNRRIILINFIFFLPTKNSNCNILLNVVLFSCISIPEKLLVHILSIIL